MADIAHEEWILLKVSALIKDTDSISDLTLLNENLAFALEGPVQNYVNITILPANPIFVNGNLVV